MIIIQIKKTCIVRFVKSSKFKIIEFAYVLKKNASPIHEILAMLMYLKYASVDLKWTLFVNTS